MEGWLEGPQEEDWRGVRELWIGKALSVALRRKEWWANEGWD